MNALGKIEILYQDIDSRDSGLLLIKHKNARPTFTFKDTERKLRIFLELKIIY